MEKRDTKRPLALWAVDPFAEDTGLQALTGRVLASLGAYDIEPVSLLPADLGDQGPRALQRIAAIGEAAAVPTLAPKLLAQPGLSLPQAVRRLAEYAGTREAELIAVGTRARRGATRLLLGSFAEALVLASPVPILVVSPEVELPVTSSVLFPTDFGKASAREFGRVLSLARRLGVPVHLFHRLTPPERMEEARNRLAEWAHRGNLQGVKVEPEIVLNGVSLTESILKRAAAGGLLAMVSHRAPGLVPSLGSTTRQVISGSRWPLWVIHRTENER